MPELRVIALGGTGAVGKNMMVLEYADEMIVVDAGMMFPGADQPGVDIVIPEMAYVLDNREKLHGVVLTHGHEDHIGAVPFLLDGVRVPIWGTPLTLALLRAKLSEFHDEAALDARVVEAGEHLILGSFDIEFIRVSHSIPQPVALGIRTPAGTIVHSGDFKFDPTPLDGRPTDLHALAAYGGETTLLISECINVDKPGHTASERTVQRAFEDLFRRVTGRVIVATFASNVGRIQQVVNVATEAGRYIALTGRSMQRVVEVARELGALQIPEDRFIPIEDIGSYADEQLCIITTGTQGEPLSALSLMAEGRHRQVAIKPGDTVVFSASPIPGNETTIFETVNRLCRRGAEVIDGRSSGMHVSGHGNLEDLKLLLALVQPRYVIPMHGEDRHLVRYRAVATEMGVPQDHVFLLDPGDVVVVSGEKAWQDEPVVGGSVMVDGLGVGDVGEVVLGDRQMMANSGVVMPVLVVDAQTCEPLSEPEVYSRGLVYVEEAGDLMDAIEDEMSTVVETLREQGGLEAENLRQRLKARVRRLISELVGRRPLVLPIVIELDTTQQGGKTPDARAKQEEPSDP